MARAAAAAGPTLVRDIRAWREVALGGGARGPGALARAVADRPATRDDLANVVALWQGDMTRLAIDGIVNAANEGLRGGGGIDGAIHRAAGPELLAECRRIGRCPTGTAVLTRGYKLPAKWVIQTVGPIGEIPDQLASCYRSCLDLAAEHKLRHISFCGISTGVYGYPVERAAIVALRTVRAWLEESPERAGAFEKIVFCCFSDRDIEVYEELLPVFFPVRTRDTAVGAETEEDPGPVEDRP